MAIKIPLKPETLDLQSIKDLIDAYNRLTQEPESETKTRFFEYLQETTGQKSPEEAYEVLTNWYFQLGGMPEDLAATVPTEKLEELKRQHQVWEAAQKEAAAVGKEEVEKFIAQNQQRIARAKEVETALKDQIVYAQVEKPEPPKLTEQEQQLVETLKEAAKTNPRQLIADLTVEIKTRIAKAAPKEIAPEEVDLLAKQAAFTVVQQLTNPDIFNETLIVNQIAAQPEITPLPVAEMAAVVATPRAEIYQTSREIVSSAFGENLTFHLIGPQTLSEIKVTLSGQPIAGGQTFALQQIPQQYSESLNNQNDFVTGLKDFGQQEVKSQLLSRASVWLDSQVAKLPVDSALAKLYSSPKIQATLSLVGIGKPIAWVGTTTFGKIAVGTGFGPAVGWLGRVTGINFGVAEVAAKVAPAAGKAVAKAGAGLLAKTGLSAVFAKVGAALGALGTPILMAIGAAVGWLVGKIIEKIPWDKVKKAAPYIIGLLIGIPMAIFFGPVIGAVVGLGTFGILSGIGLGGIGLGIARFFTGLGGVFIVTIGTPVIITLIAFPVVVALILFIINSGAYLVPPKLETATVVESPYIGVTKDIVKILDKNNQPISYDPQKGIANNLLPITAFYKVTVIAKKGSLTGVNFENICNVTKKGTPPACIVPIPSEKNVTISPTTPFVFEYDKSYPTPDFIDSFVTDVFTAKGDSPQQKGVEAAGSASLKIGSPPEECPHIWPIDQGYITQGAYTPSNMTHHTMEAIDIGTNHRPVFAGHSGIVIAAGRDSCLGNYIEIKSSCGGKNFKSQYTHLEGLKVRTGQTVIMGQNIGLSGNTGGCTTGPHLHYRFKYVPDGNPSYPKNPPYMMRPYIPADVPRGCRNSGECHVSI